MTENETNPYQPPTTVNGGLTPAEGKRPGVGSWVIAISLGLFMAAIAFFATCISAGFGLIAIFDILDTDFGFPIEFLSMFLIGLSICAATAAGIWFSRAILRLYAKNLNQSND